VSLRSNVHSAFDEITPSTLGMPERVVRTVLREGAMRQASGRLMFRIRAPLSMVATFVLIALVAAVFIGGVVVRDWKAKHGASPSGEVNQPTLSQLEAIPLNLPRLTAGDPCPDNPGVNSLGYDYGSGPVYFNGRLVPVIVSSWGYFYDLVYYSAPDLTGLVLVRGRDLRSERSILFVDQYGGGAAVDTVGLEALHGELVLNVGHPRLRDATTGYGIWYIRLGVSKGWTGCWGMQIENLDFRETITGYSPPPASP
jgi:hypothetical protein